MDDDPAEMVDRVVPLQDVADLDSMDVLNLVSASPTRRVSRSPSGMTRA